MREDNLAAAAEINKRTDGVITKSTVGIVASVNKNLSSLGSGTLLAVGDAFFVLSAGHVLREAKERDATVGIGSGNSKFVATTRNWLISGGSSGTDEHDIAMYQLTREEAFRLSGAEFVRIGDVSFEVDLSNSFFVVCGFPALWSKSPSATGDDPMLTKLLIYGTTLYNKEARALEGFDAERHFLLDARQDEMYNDAGDIVGFRTRGGFPAPFPNALGGISGCSVWRMGSMGVHPRHWGAPQLVGVETAVYSRIQAIRATRWNSVTTLLHAAFPELRPVLTMYIEMYNLR